MYNQYLAVKYLTNSDYTGKGSNQALVLLLRCPNYLWEVITLISNEHSCLCMYTHSWVRTEIWNRPELISFPFVYFHTLLQNSSVFVYFLEPSDVFIYIYIYSPPPRVFHYHYQERWAEICFFYLVWNQDIRWRKLLISPEQLFLMIQ